MPRKTDVPGAGQRGPERASMRPRPDAAENARRQDTTLGVLCASMRPRPDAAENPEAGAYGSTA